MNIVIKSPNFCTKRFNTSIEQAKNNARTLVTLFERLELSGDTCKGMKVSMGGDPFVVVKEGDTFFIVDKD